MPFQARLLKQDINPFGLGFLYTVLFSDGTTGHLYSAAGRFTGPIGTPVASWTKIATSQDDVRFQAPSDAAFKRAIYDHVNVFNAVATTAAAPTLPAGQNAAFLDLSDVQPAPPPPTADQLAVAKYQRAIALVQQLKTAVDANLIAADDALITSAQQAAVTAFAAIKTVLSAAVGQ